MKTQQPLENSRMLGWRKKHSSQGRSIQESCREVGSPGVGRGAASSPQSKVPVLRSKRNTLKIFSVSLLNKERGGRQNASCSLTLQKSKHAPLSPALRYRDREPFLLSLWLPRNNPEVILCFSHGLSEALLTGSNEDLAELRANTALCISCISVLGGQSSGGYQLCPQNQTNPAGWRERPPCLPACARRHCHKDCVPLLWS